MKTCTQIVIRLLTAVFGLLFLSMAHAQEEKFLSGSLTTKLNTAYVSKAGIVLYDNPTSVNVLDLNFGKDWTAEVWSSTHLGSENYISTYGDEFDLLAMYHHNFLEDFRLLATGGYLAFKNLGRSNNDLWIAEAEMSYTKYSYFMPYFCVRHFGTIGEKSAGAGWIGWVGARGSYPTGMSHLKLNLDLSLSYSDGALGRTPGADYARAVISLPIQVSESWTLTPSVLLQAPLGNQASHKVCYTKENEVVGSVALRYKF